MKHQAHTVDIRIKQFMKRKMAEYPELREKYGPRVQEVQRGYMWEDLTTLFTKRVRAR